MSEPEKSERHDATTFDGLSRLSFASSWDPDTSADWSQAPVLPEAVRRPWIQLLQFFYEGEWQGLHIIQRLMNPAARRYRRDDVVTYYSTQCFEESRHLYVFRKYLALLGAPPRKAGAFDPLVFLATTGPWKVERWILGTWFTETLAASIFQGLLESPIDPLGKQVVRLMLKDETRHIAGTKLAVSMVHGGLRTGEGAILRGWWKLFRRLAEGEVCRLDGVGRALGLPAEDMIRLGRKRTREGLGEREAAWLGE